MSIEPSLPRFFFFSLPLSVCLSVAACAHVPLSILHRSHSTGLVFPGLLVSSFVSADGAESVRSIDTKEQEEEKRGEGGSVDI